VRGEELVVRSEGGNPTRRREDSDRRPLEVLRTFLFFVREVIREMRILGSAEGSLIICSAPISFWREVLSRSVVTLILRPIFVSFAAATNHSVQTDEDLLR
jgi:hypothetical protein